MLVTSSQTASGYSASSNYGGRHANIIFHGSGFTDARLQRICRGLQGDETNVSYPSQLSFPSSSDIMAQVKQRGPGCASAEYTSSRISRVSESESNGEAPGNHCPEREKGESAAGSGRVGR